MSEWPRVVGLVLGSVCVMYVSDVDGDMEECGDGDMNQGDMDVVVMVMWMKVVVI